MTKFLALMLQKIGGPQLLQLYLQGQVPMEEIIQEIGKAQLDSYDATNVVRNINEQFIKNNWGILRILAHPEEKVPPQVTALLTDKNSGANLLTAKKGQST